VLRKLVKGLLRRESSQKSKAKIHEPLNPAPVAMRPDLEPLHNLLDRMEGCDGADRKRLCDETRAVFASMDAHIPGPAYKLRTARKLFNAGLNPEALRAVDHFLEALPSDVGALALKSGILVALARHDEALALSHEILKLDPSHTTALYHSRLLPKLGAVTAKAQAVAGRLTVEGAEEPAVLVEKTGQIWHPDPTQSFLQQLQSLPANILAISRIEDDQLSRAVQQLERDFGIGLFADDASGLRVWRRDALVNLARIGFLTSWGALPQEARALEWAFRRDARQEKPGRVALMSRQGGYKFGGAEHFLESVALHYRDMGYEPAIIGTRREALGEVGFNDDGIPLVFFENDPDTHRRYFLENEVKLVHVLPGLGYEVAIALEWMNIPLIYGVHFWRDCFNKDNVTSSYFDAAGQPNLNRDFHYILRNATVYANSQFTQRTIEKAFGVRCPIIYSVPNETSNKGENDLEDVGEGFVLLANTRADKGFDLIKDVARLLPEVNFVAIYSQPDETGEPRSDLPNVRIIGKTDRIDDLYRSALAVAVPSYRFVESFSRVCIEAQRLGVPVIGSDVGNVPYLIEQSGVSLPEDAMLWAAEIRRLRDDAAYREERKASAMINARAYSQLGQKTALAGVVGSASSPILVGIGSGIGNMLHVGPMIRNMSKRLRRQVDLLVAEDHSDSLFLLHNREYINAVHSLQDCAADKYYDTVFLTHCFGRLELKFNTTRLIRSRDWDMFAADHEFHETLFNLEAAKQLLGIDYHENDIRTHFISDIGYTWPAGNLVGMHGGSKQGHWASKRWPGFAEFAAELKKAGYRVASFGMKDEYVLGTEDFTGGTIEEMAKRMCQCSYFISNDSGVMNIANALGIPLIAIFGPTNPKTRRPLSPKSVIVSREEGFTPCEYGDREHFISGQCDCIHEVPIEKVGEAFKSLIAALQEKVDAA
jgi:glycosyltransferase involved in cell wall biosynthesis